jgi:hypothetical protein
VDKAGKSENHFYVWQKAQGNLTVEKPNLSWPSPGSGAKFMARRKSINHRQLKLKSPSLVLLGIYLSPALY